MAAYSGNLLGGGFFLLVCSVFIAFACGREIIRWGHLPPSMQPTFRTAIVALIISVLLIIGGTLAESR